MNDASSSGAIPGLSVVPLTPHSDARGTFVELYRAEWDTGPAPIQWNAALSHAGVLRGVHVHRGHSDYLTVVSGTLVLGLHDLRPEDPAERASLWLTLTGTEPLGVGIPPGVCHGFWFPEPTVHVYGVSSYWDVGDELGCRFDDPDLGLTWPERAPVLSARDEAAGGYAAMRAAYVGGAA